MTVANATSPVPQPPPPANAAIITQRIALLSVVVALVLIGAKAFAWMASSSVAILASLADSMLDLVASLFTFFAVRYAAAPPDREHRFGHGKAEAFAGLFQAGLVAVSAAMVAIESLTRFWAPEPIAAGEISIAVMIFASAATAWLIWMQTNAVRQTGSIATKGDRAHYAADLGANLVTMIGVVGGALFGLTALDALAGLAVAGLLAVGAWTVAAESADHLMDRELPDADRAVIESLALEDPAVRGVHDLRTRTAGPITHIQFHADLDGAQSLLHAHAIIVAAEQRIRARFPGADIIIHADPQGHAEPHGHAYFAKGDLSA